MTICKLRYKAPDRGLAVVVIAHLAPKQRSQRRPGCRIDLRVRAEAYEVRIEVEDAGIGMRPELLAEILSHYDQNARVASEADEALAAAREERADGVLRALGRGRSEGT